MKKTAGIVLSVLIICVSVFGLCSCGSDEKSIIGTWTAEELYLTFKFTFSDDNTVVRQAINRDGTTSDYFSWEIHSTYTFTDENGENVTFEPSEKYDGVLIVNDDDIIDTGDIAYYRFDDNKEKLYIADPEGETVEVCYTRE